MKTNEINYAELYEIQVDRSGVGHCWVGIDHEDIFADILEEILTEAIEGGDREEWTEYTATNGVSYRYRAI
jgi:hypothetical protein